MDWREQLAAWRQRGVDLGRRFDARASRERMALIMALLALLLLAADRLWLTNAFSAFGTASKALSAARAEQQALDEDTRRRRVQGDANRRALDQEIAQWRQRTTEGARTLADAQAGLIGPDRMVALLEQMLPRHGGVKVVSLTTVPAQDARTPLADMPGAAKAAGAVAAVKADASAEGRAPLYRHGVDLTVEGSYGDLMAWLTALETLPGPRLLWGGLKLNAERHPSVQLSLTVYTLSLDREWLEL